MRIAIIDKNQKTCTIYTALSDAAGHVGVSSRTISRRLNVPTLQGWYEDAEFIIVESSHIGSPKKKNSKSFGNQ